MRLLEILYYLLRCNYIIKIKELASIFNVSIKTIQRDLDKLSVAGIPIIIHRGKNGGVEIDRNYILSRPLLRYQEYEALIFSLYIGQSISDNVREAYLIDKFKNIDYNTSSKVLNKLKERLIVDLCKEKIDVRSEVCKEIDKALDNKSFVEFEVNGKKSIVLPISYVLREEGLCLYCYNKVYKLILVNKISKVIVSNKKYNTNIISYNDNRDKIKVTK